MGRRAGTPSSASREPSQALLSLLLLTACCRCGAMAWGRPVPVLRLTTVAAPMHSTALVAASHEAGGCEGPSTMDWTAQKGQEPCMAVRRRRRRRSSRQSGIGSLSLRLSSSLSRLQQHSTSCTNARAVGLRLGHVSPEARAGGCEPLGARRECRTIHVGAASLAAPTLEVGHPPPIGAPGRALR